MRPDISLKSLFIVFLFFFGFLKVVATFGQKPKKTSRNQKKNEKQKKKHEKKKNKRLGVRRLYEARHFPQIFVFLCFFSFSRSFFGF